MGVLPAIEQVRSNTTSLTELPGICFTSKGAVFMLKSEERVVGASYIIVMMASEGIENAVLGKETGYCNVSEVYETG